MEMMSANDVTFGSLKVLFNSQINDVMVVKIRQYDGSYVPRTTFPLNRTLVHTESSTVTQMEILINLCEVVLPSNHNNFKQYVFRDLVNYMLKSIETISVNIVNEIGFKLFFYVPSDSPASNSQWWEDTGITKKGWNRNDMNYNQTLLGTGLNGNYIRYCLTIYLDDNRQLIGAPVTPLVSQNCQGQTYQTQNYQPNPWSSSLPQTSPWGSSPVNIWGNSTSNTNALNTSGGSVNGGNNNPGQNNPWGTSWSSSSILLLPPMPILLKDKTLPQDGLLLPQVIIKWVPPILLLVRRMFHRGLQHSPFRQERLLEAPMLIQPAQGLLFNLYNQ